MSEGPVREVVVALSGDVEGRQPPTTSDSVWPESVHALPDWLKGCRPERVWNTPTSSP